MKPLNLSHDPFSSLENWEFSPTFRDKTRIEGVTIFLCGMQASHPQWGEVVGSSAHLASSPENNACYELMERIAIIQAMQNSEFSLRHPATGALIGPADPGLLFPKARDSSYQFSKSNAVALFSTWPEACRRACLELVERHLVLASWLGITRPQEITNIPQSPLSELKRVYDVKHISFGKQKVSAYPGNIHVSGVVLYPKNLNDPLVFAFGAGQSLNESIQKAEAETWQRLGFLWGEEIPGSEPEFLPSQLYHQEYYLYPEHHPLIESWLKGQFYQADKTPLPDILHLSFVDISSAQMPQFKVAKALSHEAIPLVFGKWKEGLFAELDEDRLIHPIA